MTQTIALVLLIVNSIIAVFTFRHLFIAQKPEDRGTAGFWLCLSLNACYHMWQEVVK